MQRMVSEAGRKSLRGVIFDLDGTLLDSVSIHFECFRKACAHFGIVITQERFVAAYSPDWNQTYGSLGLQPGQWETATTIWRAEAARLHADLFPEVRDMLRRLSESYHLGLLTSGSKVRVLRDLKRTQIRELFSTVITGEDVARHKPAPDGLEHILRQWEMAADEVIYVGDAVTDYETARAAQVAFVGVLSGINPAEFQHPEFKLRSVAELWGFLHQSPEARDA